MTKFEDIKSTDGFEISKDIIARRNQDGTVVAMKADESNLFYKIDGIASQVWTELIQQKTLSELVAKFESNFPQFKDQLSRDLPAFLSDLLQKGLLTKNLPETEKAILPGAVTSPQVSSGEYYFGGAQAFNLEEIEAEVLNESVYLDVFAGSDMRLKKNITPIEGALSKIQQLEGVNFEWKSEEVPHAWGKPTETLQAGILAQQVATVMPELVRSDSASGMLMVDYTKMNSYFIEAIKELNQLLTVQQKKIQELESRVPRLTS